MIAELKFNLPEEEPEFKLASNAGKLASALWDVEQTARNFVKYNSDRATKDDYHKVIGKLRGIVAEVEDLII